jgi:hypothetical protein
VVAAEVVPEVFDRVEFRRGRRERDESEVGGRAEGLGGVVAGVVPDQGDVSAGRDRGGELVEERLDDGRVESLGDEALGPAGGRTDGGEDVETFEPALFRGGRPGPGVGPDGGQRPLLAEPGLVLEPDLDGLAGVGGCEGGDRVGRFFRNASCAAGSAVGCFGRGRRQEKPRAWSRS